MSVQRMIDQSLIENKPLSLEKKQVSEKTQELIDKMLAEEQEQIKIQQEESRKNEKAARYLQEQFEIEQIQKSQQNDELQNKPQDCLICLEKIDYDELWPITQCGHIFHRQCLNQGFAIKIKLRQFPLRCPFPKCNQEVIYEDLVETLDEELLEQFDQYTFNQFVDAHGDDMSWCPTPDCSYAFVYEQGANQQDFQFNCPKCQVNYCLNCRVIFHQRQTCMEYKINNKFDKNDELFINFVRGKKFKQCPKCKFWVEKNQKGCDHMTCRCTYQFCYICGGEYGNCLCNKAQPQQGEVGIRPIPAVRVPNQPHVAFRSMVPNFPRFPTAKKKKQPQRRLQKQK